MQTITEIDPSDLATVASPITWTGLAPGYELDNATASDLLAYCGGLSASLSWVVVDVGRWKRTELRRRNAVGTSAYNEAVGQLYRELSGYLPSVESPTSWRSYLNVGDNVAYGDRVEGYGPATYIPVLSYAPDVWRDFVEAVKDGTHQDMLAQLHQRKARLDAIHIAPNGNGNGYHVGTEDDVPFSGSGHNYSNGNGPVAAYEDSEVDTDSGDWETLLQDVKILVAAVTDGHWGQAQVIAHRLRWLVEG